MKNLRQRLDALEAEAGRIDPRLLEPDAGPVTEEDVARELVAHVLWHWHTRCLPTGTTDVDNLCLGPAPSEPDPDGRWSWPTWQPDRPAGDPGTRRPLLAAHVGPRRPVEAAKRAAAGGPEHGTRRSPALQRVEQNGPRSRMGVSRLRGDPRTGRSIPVRADRARTPAVGRRV